MAHWAKINKDGIVENIIVTSNDEPDEGESWIASNLDGTWIKTSYNTYKGKHLLGGTPLRMNFATIGGTYDLERDAFVPPKMDGEENFILYEPTMSWIPAPIPEDATYALPYGPEPDYVETEIVDENGNILTTLEPQIKDTDVIYFWYTSEEKSGWWLKRNANYPKPGDNYKWDGFLKQWVEKTS